MIYLNEWLPNPPGKDDGEFVELYNSGKNAVSLDGYSLSSGGKKTFSFSGYRISANGYLVFKKSTTKLTLKNSDGIVLLYGPSGQVVDESTFNGTAPVGESFSRVYYGVENGYAKDAQPQSFIWSDPTPGADNGIMNVSIAANHYPLTGSLTKRVGPGEFFGLMIGTAAVLASAFIYVIQKNENIQKLFFGRNA